MSSVSNVSRFSAPRQIIHHDFRRALVAAALFAGLFVTAFAMGPGRLGFSGHKAADRVAAASRQSDDDLTTGSIVFVPVLGDECRQNIIDNATWTVREVGAVSCDEALKAGGRRSGRQSRLDLVRESFRGGR